MRVGTLEIEMLANIARLQQDMDAARNSVGTAMTQIEKTVGMATAALGAFTAALSVGAVAKYTKSIIDAADAFGDLEERTGIAFDTLQKYDYAARLSDTSTDTLRKGLIGLSKTMDEAMDSGSESAKLFKAMGINIRDSAGKMRPMEQVFEDITEKMSGYENGNKKIALALKAFGKAGEELIPFLNNGKKGLKEIGEEAKAVGAYMSKDFQQQSAAFNDALDKIGVTGAGAIRGIAASQIEKIMPALVAIAEAGVKASKNLGPIADAITNIAIAGGVWIVAAHAGAIATTAYAAAWTAYSHSVGVASFAMVGLSGAMSAVSAAGAVLFAAVAGYQLGKILHDNFEEARLAGVVMVNSVMKGWVYIKTGAEAAWIGIKQIFFGSIDLMIDAWAGFVEKIGRAMQKIPGMQELAKTQLEYADAIKNSAKYSTGLAEEQAKLQASARAELAVITEITDEMALAATATEKFNTEQKKTTEEAPSVAGGINETAKAIDALIKKIKGEYTEAMYSLNPAYEKMTKAEKGLVAIVNDRNGLWDKLSSALQEELRATVKLTAEQERQHAAGKVAAQIREDYEKSILDQVKASQTALDTARQELENYGKTPAMIARVTLAKLRDKEATALMTVAGQEEMAAIREQIRLQEQLIGVLHSRQEIEGKDKEAQAIAEANKKAAEDAAAEWKKTAEQISDGITDALMRGFESGKGFAKNFRDTVVNMFKTMVLRPQIQAIVGGAFGLNGTAQAGQTGAGGLGGAAQSMGGLAGLANTFSLSGVGQALGLSTSAFATNTALAAQYATFSEVGIGAATTLTSAGTSLAGAAGAIASAAPYLAAAAAVFSYFKSKEGGPKSGGFARQDFDPAGRAYDSAITSRLFTPDQSDADVMKAVRDTGAGFTAQLKALGGKGGATFGLGFDTDPQGTAPNRISGEAFVNGQSVYSQRDRGIGRDNNAIAGELALETQRMMLAAIKASDLPPEVAKIISEGIPDATKASAEEIKAVLGDATFWKAAFVDAPQQIATLFGQAVSLDQFKAVQQGGETLAQTFDRLQPVFAATNLAALVMGRDLATAFGAAGLASSAAREELARFAGGAQALQSQLDGFYQNYFTEAERSANTTAQLAKEFEALGVPIQTTREGFRDLVKAQDPATESGRKLIAGLLNMQERFASVTKSAEDLAAAAKEQAEADKARFEDVAASIGLSFDSLKSNALAGIAEPESAKLAGDMFADSVVGGIYTALQGQMAQQITDIITNSLVTPIVNSVIAGTSITEAVSKESIAEMVKSATKVAEAFGELFRSDDFKNLIATIRSGLAQIGSATYTASTYVPRPLALPTRENTTTGTTSTPETVTAPELPSIADWIREMNDTLADMRAPNDYARQIGQINRQAAEGAQRIADFLLPYEKLGKTTPEYAQAAEDAAEATRLLTQSTQAQIAAVREQQRQAVSEIVTGIADTITLGLMSPLDAAIARADIDAMKLIATLDKLGDTNPENRAAVILQRNLAVETAKFNAELEKLQARFADLQAVTGLIDSINDAIRTVLVDSKQMSEIDAINQQIGRAKQQVTDAVPNGPQATVAAANELISLTMQRYNLEKAASEAITGNAKAQLDFAKQVRSYLKTLASSELSPFDFETRLRAAQTDFRDTLALAKSGDLTAQGRLQSTADNALKLTKDYYSISKPYGDFFGEVTAGLEGMTASLETDAEKQTGLLTSLNDKARATLAELIGYRTVAQEYQSQVQAAFDAQTQAVVKQYQAIEALGLSMTTLNTTLLALPLDLRTAFAASATGTTPPRQTVGADLASIAGMAAGGNLAGALGVANGQYSAAQLADYWNSKNPQGERITAGNIEDFARANGIPGFANGGIIGGPSLVMAGEAGAEAIVPLRGGAIPVTIDARNYGRSDDAMVRELAAVRAELKESMAQQAKIADALMRQQAKIAEAELEQGAEQTKVLKTVAAELTT